MTTSKQGIDGGRACTKSGGEAVSGWRGLLHGSDHRIELVPVGRLVASGRNARTHSKKQIRQIADSIAKFGFNNPVLLDDGNEIIAGHGRVEAAKFLGLEAVPTLRLSHLSKADKRAYVIADNRLAELAGWDREILALELEALIDVEFEVELIGFEAGEIDVILDEAEAASRDESSATQVDEDVSEPSLPVTLPGDLWLLGKHRILCGDATDNDAYLRLLDGAKAQFVFSDPPYNVAIRGHACRGQTITHREFAMASGEMTEEEFGEFLESVFGHLVAHSENGAIHDICMDWRHAGEMLSAGRKVYSELKNVCVWAKPNPGMGYFYRSQHEFVFIWKSGSAPHISNIASGQNGNSRSNIWNYPTVKSTLPAQAAEFGGHPTVKPVALVADAMRDCSRRNGLVLDPFLGSGTTLMAAQHAGRHARGIEIDPAYVDVAIRRWQRYTGKEATLLATGKTFDEVQQERTDPASGSINATPEIAALKEAA